MDIKKLLIRTISGIIYVAIIVGCILWGNWGVTILGLLISVFATIEFEKVCYNNSKVDYRLLYFDVLGVMLLSQTFNYWIPFITLVFWISVMLIRVIVQLYIKDQNPITSLSLSFFAQLYIGVPLATMGGIAVFFEPALILLIFLLIWINDTGAYIVGSLIGKKRLFERISPKKSWEGFIGGLVFTVGASIIFYYSDPALFWGFDVPISQWIVTAFIVVLFGTLGDLVESMFKRQVNMKDSGHIIPGHGGILDRLDSFLIAMPAFFLYIILYYFLEGYIEFGI